MEHRQCLHKFLRADTAQTILAKVIGNGAHFVGDSRIVSRQIRMTSAGAHHHQCIPVRCEVEGGGANFRILMLKVHRHKAAGRRRHLIHQSTGLAKEHVFRILADLRPSLVVHRHAVVEIIKDSAHQHFKGCGRAQSTAGGHRRGYSGIKAADAVAQLRHSSCHAANQRCSRPLLLFMHRQVGQIQRNGCIAFTVQVHKQIFSGADCRQGIQVHRSCQHPAMVVIRMITADFRPSGGTDECHITLIIKGFLMTLQHVDMPCRLSHKHTVPAAVQVIQLFHYLGGFQTSDFTCILTHDRSPSFSCYSFCSVYHTE